MSSPPAGPIARAHGDVRGTQSFVGVMALVWKRPRLTAIEVAWRWTASAICSLVGLSALISAFAIPRSGAAAGFSPVQISISDPLQAAETLHAVAAPLLAKLLPALWWAVPLAFFLWAGIAMLGRNAVARRLMTASPAASNGAVFVLTLLRALAFTVLMAIWVAILRAAAQWTIAAPILRGGEPNLVGYFALGVVATLLVFIVWSAESSVLRLAPLIAIAQGRSATDALRAAAERGPLRAKLVEINLVMGIVKVALVVLAMVFSATPLPFQNYATQGFLWGWWAVVTLLYFIASDYFHVVHAASYLLLWKEFRTGHTNDAAVSAS